MTPTRPAQSGPCPAEKRSKPPRLALALSRQVASLAASGAAKLESIFLDEGFGTLDETSLDVVAATLENLAGERMVGVITHVPALADRIPVRFQVTRTGARSHIERITA
jgi:exonuclease SbcC